MLSKLVAEIHMHSDGHSASGGPQAPPSEEVQLTRRVASGERGAAQELSKIVMQTVVDTVRYLSFGHRDSDDFIQIALTEILKSASSFAGIGGLQGWARRITVRSTLRQVKKLRRRQATVSLVPDPGDNRAKDEIDLATRTAMRTRLAAVMQSLKPERRAVVMLRLVFGLSIAEIAQETDTSERTVKFRLLSGTRRLRKLISSDPVLQTWRGDDL